MRTIGLLLLAGAGLLGAENLRMMTQVIEVPHKALTKWTSRPALSGEALHRAAMDLVEDGGARVVDTTVQTCRPDGSPRRARANSVAEVIYPTEVNGGALVGSPAATLGAPEFPGWKGLLRHCPTAFETRYTGTSVEFSPRDGSDGVVEFGVAVEMVGRLPDTEWRAFRDGKGDASIRFPRFRTQKHFGLAKLAPGKSELVAVWSPEPMAVPAVEKRWLVFVRVEVLNLEGVR